MATTCNFGQVKDLRVRDLCVGSKQLIDAKCNLYPRELNTKNVCVNHLKTNADKLILNGNIDAGDSYISTQTFPLVNHTNVIGNIIGGLIAPIPLIDGPFDGSTISLVGGPCFGTVSDISNDEITYESDPFFFGLDVITYTVEDECGVNRTVHQFICVGSDVIL